MKKNKRLLLTVSATGLIFLIGVAISLYSTLLTEIIVVSLLSVTIIFILAQHISRPVIKITMLGFLLHLFLAFIQRFLINLPDSTADAVTFEARAWANAKALLLGGETAVLDGPYYYSAFLSYVYYLLGRTPLVGQFVNVVLGTLLIYIAYQIAFTLFNNKRAAVVSAVTTAVFPTLNLYSAILMRETFIVVFFALSLLFFSYFLKKGGTFNIVICTFFILLSSILHGGMFLVGLGYLVIYCFYLPQKKQFSISAKQIFTGVVITTIYSFVFFSFFVTKIPSFFDFIHSVEKAEMASESRAMGRTAYLKEISPNNFFDVAWQTPLRSVYLFLTPFPWQIENKLDLIGLSDALLYLMLLILSFKTFLALIKKDKATAISLLLIFILFTGPFAWGTSNYGSAVRHRQKIVLLLIVAASYSFSHLSFKKKHSQKTVAYFSNTDFSLKNFRFSLLDKMKKNGYRVWVLATTTNVSDTETLQENFSFYNAPLNRGFSIDIAYFLRVFFFCLREKPLLCHNFTIKPCIFASLAQQLAGVKKIYCTITGLGYAFEKDNWFQKIIILLYRVAFKRVQHVIFQNPDDREKFIQLKIVSLSNSSVILSSGVNTDYFSREKADMQIVKKLKKEISYSDQKTYVTLVARLLYQKGVEEFATAGKVLKKEGFPVEFLLVGPLDKDNPSAIEKNNIEAWEKEGAFTYLGQSNNIREILALTNISILPSYYREGVPKALLEAGSMSLPIITTDTPGCREVVKNNLNGFLIQPQNHKQIVTAIRKIVENNLSEKMGYESRKLVEEKFHQEIVVKQTIAVYNL